MANTRKSNRKPFEVLLVFISLTAIACQTSQPPKVSLFKRVVRTAFMKQDENGMQRSETKQEDKEMQRPETKQNDESTGDPNAKPSPIPADYRVSKLKVFGLTTGVAGFAAINGVVAKAIFDAESNTYDHLENDTQANLLPGLTSSIPSSSPVPGLNEPTVSGPPNSNLESNAPPSPNTPSPLLPPPIDQITVPPTSASLFSPPIPPPATLPSNPTPVTATPVPTPRDFASIPNNSEAFSGRL